MKSVWGKLLIIVLLVITVSSAKTTMGLFGRTDALKETERELQEAQKEQEELVKAKEQINTQEFIEGQARENLGLAKPGETVVVLPDKEILRRLALKIDDEEYFPQPKPIWRRWVELFF